MKQPVKCWECGGHHLHWDCPMREIAAKFLDFGISKKLRTSRKSPWKPRGLVVNVPSK